MAARPILAKLCRDIERNGGDEALFERYASGETIAEIMASYGVTRPMWYQWLKKGGKVRQDASVLAKELRSHVLVEDAWDELNNPKLKSPTNAEVSLAGQKSKYKLWLAGKLNRADYGDDVAIAVNAQLNIGSLHLNALIEGGLTPIAPAPEQGVIEEAEILSIEPAELDAEEEFNANSALAD